MKLPETQLTASRRVEPNKQRSEGAGPATEAPAGRAGPLPSVPLPQNRSLLIPRWGDNKPESLSTTVTKPVKASARGRWVRFELLAPEARTVFLAGSFKGWNPKAIPMMRLHDGKWAKELRLPTGRYEYLFVVDGQWIADPKALDFVPNPFGGCNSVMKVE
jgi:hypothetical protein